MVEVVEASEHSDEESSFEFIEAEDVIDSVREAIQHDDPSPEGTIERSLQDFMKYLISLENVMEERQRDSIPLGEQEVSRISSLWQEIEDHPFKPVGFDHPKALACLEAIRTTLKNGGDPIYIVPSLLVDLRSLLFSLRPVNLVKLCRLLQQNRGTSLQGKDILLLLGASGAGKTTTLLFLGGAKFQETEVNGFDHLEPLSFPDERMQEFATSCGTKSVTCALQSIQVNDEMVICDTPGFFHTDDVEMDIANGLGVVREIQTAKSVRPVVVLSRDGMGDRFQAVSDALAILTRMLLPSNLQCFSYIFTKYPDKFTTRLAKQFQAMRSSLGPQEYSDPLLVALIDDIIAKSKPRATIVNPVDGNAQEVLQNLLSSGDSLEPASFIPFMSEAAGNKLRTQLSIQVENIERALNQQQYIYSAFCLDMMIKLAELLPDVNEYTSRGTDISKKHVLNLHDEFTAALGRAENWSVPVGEDAVLVRQIYDRILQAEPVRELCLPNDVRGEEFCRTSVAELIDCVRRDTIPQDDKGDYDSISLLEQIDSFLLACARLDGLQRAFPEAISTFRQSLQVLVQCSSILLDATESPHLMDDFEKLGSFSESILCIFNALDSYQGKYYIEEDLKKQKDRFEKLKLWFNSSVGRALGEMPLGDGAELEVGAEYRLMTLLDLDVHRSARARQLLLDICKADALFQSLSGMNIVEIHSAVEIFEETFVAHLRELISLLQTMLENLMQSQQDKTYSRAISQYLAALRSALARTSERVELARGWSPVMSSTLDEDLKRMRVLESAVESYASHARSVNDGSFDLSWAEVGAILVGLAAFALARR